MNYTSTVSDQIFVIEINREDEIVVNGKAYAVNFVKIGGGNLHSLLIDNESYEALIEERDGLWQVLLHGDLYSVDVADERAQRMAARTMKLVPESGELAVKAPMPGLVVSVPVKAGQEVREGDPVVILESMKMENELKTPRAGIVERVAVQPGDSVEQHQVLLFIV